MAATEDPQAASFSAIDLQNAFEGAQAVSVFADVGAFEEALRRAQANSVSDSGSEDEPEEPEPANGSNSTSEDALEPQATSISDLSPEDAPKKAQITRLFDFSSKNIVTLIVGPEQEKMLVHGTYLARDSDFFKAALKKEWIEGKTRTIRLPDEDPEVMAHYLAYVYDKELSTKDNSLKKESDFDRAYCLLFTLYVCGERLLNVSLQRAVINKILWVLSVKSQDGSRYGPDGQNVSTIYNGTTANSPALRLMVDLYIALGNKGWFEETMDPAFLADLAKTLHGRYSKLTSNKDRGLRSLKAGDYL